MDSFSTGIGRVALTAGTDERAYRAAGEPALERALRAATVLRPRTFRLLLPMLEGNAPGETAFARLQREFPWIIGVYCEWVDRIAAAGLVPLLENEVRPCLFATPADITGFFTTLDRPAARYTWDVQNLWQSGIFPSLEVYRQVRPFMGALHLKGGRSDLPGGPLVHAAPLEEASWPVLEIVRAVVAEGATPVLCLNPSHGQQPPGWDIWETACRDLAFLRRDSRTPIIRTPVPMRPQRDFSLLLLAVALLFALTAPALRAVAVVPAPLFRDHAVLQQGRPLPVWGTAGAGEKVTVAFAGQTVSTAADAAGNWGVTLSPLKVNASPDTLTITGNGAGTNVVVTVRDVLVGEVWLCSGQSNMEFKLAAAANAAAEIAAADFPAIRQFSVAYHPANDPQRTVSGGWTAASPATAREFTAVGYFFGRELHRRLGVPVGLVNSSWGGTRIESWMSAGALAKPEFAFAARRWQEELADYPARQAKYEARMAEIERLAAEAAAAGKPYKKPWVKKPAAPGGDPHQDQPSALFNGKIAPLTPAALAGVLWYQGESNAIRPAEYRQLFPALIADWRSAFARPDLPFYWVQLSAFVGSPGEDWAALREAQAAPLALPATGQAVTVDIGEEKNIHPTNKQDVGLRLALVALQRHYGQNVIASGPVFQKVEFRDGAARLTFTEIADGLVARGGTLGGFELAGADRKFVPAEARIEGTTVRVSSAAVPAPIAVRYAWKNYVAATLANTANLPAAPFRSDAW